MYLSNESSILNMIACYVVNQLPNQLVNELYDLPYRYVNKQITNLAYDTRSLSLPTTHLPIKLKKQTS